MTNVVRKEIRRIQEMLSQLEKTCSNTEQVFIQNARIALCQADYHDFHMNPGKKYKVPKTSFKYADIDF